jgi:hypothetical protein
LAEIRDGFTTSACRAAAFAIPLGLGIVAASPEPYWLDSPELTAAAATLGVPHPPGHPLYVMLVKPFTLLPVGSIAFRVALASAVFGALASLALFEIAFLFVAYAAPRLSRRSQAVIAAATALTAAVAPGWWFQSVRAEVYSLQALLVLTAFYLFARHGLSREPQGDGALKVGAFVCGLGLANHHFIMLAAVPAAIPRLVALARTRGGPGALWLAAKLAGCAAVGLLPYLFIPIRTLAGAPVALGGAATPGELAWVVSAKVYQKSMAAQELAGLDERTLDAVFSMMQELGPVVVVSALAGLYLLLRRRETALAATMLAALGGVTILLRSVMTFDPFNPDYYGYMQPAVAAIAVAAGVFAAVSVDVLARGLPRGGIVGALLTAATLALPIAHGREARAAVDLSGFRATRLYLDLAIGSAEPGATVLVSYYKPFFALWAARYVDGARSDLAIVNPQLFGYPGYLRSALAAHPDLKRLAHAMLVKGAVTEAAISALAYARPLRVEPSPWVEEPAFRYLLPGGAMYRALPEPLGIADVRDAAGGHFAAWERFYDLLGTGWQEHETWRMLVWSHYLDALYFARRGDREDGRKALDLSRKLGSDAPELVDLGALLDKPGKGPIDVAPLLPGYAPGTSRRP